jgi:hypothetical protein
MRPGISFKPTIHRRRIPAGSPGSPGLSPRRATHKHLRVVPFRHGEISAIDD